MISSFEQGYYAGLVDSQNPRRLIYDVSHLSSSSSIIKDASSAIDKDAAADTAGADDEDASRQVTDLRCYFTGASSWLTGDCKIGHDGAMLTREKYLQW